MLYIGKQFSFRLSAYNLDWFFKNTVSYYYSLVLFELTCSEWQIEDKNEIHLNVKERGKKRIKLHRDSGNIWKAFRSVNCNQDRNHKQPTQAWPGKFYVKTSRESYVHATFFQTGIKKWFQESKLYWKKVLEFGFLLRIKVEFFFYWQNVTLKFEIKFYCNLDSWYVLTSRIME